MIYRTILTIIMFMLLGCANPNIKSEISLAEDYGGLDAKSRILMLPVLSDYTDLVDEEEYVEGLIVDNLRAKGFAVLTMSNERYDSLLGAVKKKIGGMYSSSTGKIEEEKLIYALLNVILSARQREEFDVAIVPKLVPRSANLRGSHAYWDGVKVKKPARGSGADDMRWSGKVRALSLQVTAFKIPVGSGEKFDITLFKWIFNSYGGLTIPYITVFKNGTPYSELRDNMFEKTSEVSRGVQEALSPIKVDSDS